MKKENSKRTPPPALTITTLLAVGVAMLFLAPFFGVIVTSLIIAFSFQPLYTRIKKRIKSKQAAAALTLGVAAVTVVVPVLAVIGVTVNQAYTLSTDIQDTFVIEGTQTSPDGLIESSTQAVATITGGLIDISPAEVQDTIGTIGSSLATNGARLLGGAVSSVTGIITALVLFMYIFLGTLTYQREMITFIKKLNPLGDDVADLYLKRAGAMTNGMVRGQFIIALVQGAIGAITLWIAGVPYVSFLFIALTFLSIIPLGGGILSIPIGAILLITGNVWQGLVVLLGHFLLVTNADNVLRPVLIPKEARLPSALTLLGVFAGLAAFGFLGLIIGPVLMILIVTTLEVYTSYQSNGIDSQASTV